jgi:hypothetical protein
MLKGSLAWRWSWGGPVEPLLKDLDAAIDDVRALVTGQEIAVDEPVTAG